MGCTDCTTLHLDENKEPPCEGCYVELDEANHEIWKLYILCHDQVRMTSMGDVIGLDHNSVIADIRLYHHDEWEQQRLFEGVTLCWTIEQECKK